MGDTDPIPECASVRWRPIVDLRQSTGVDRRPIWRGALRGGNRDGRVAPYLLLTAEDLRRLRCKILLYRCCGRWIPPDGLLTYRFNRRQNVSAQPHPVWKSGSVGDTYRY